MLEEKQVCPYCGGCCEGDEDNKPQEEEKTQEKKSQKMIRDEFHFAILLALVPAMAMSLFNLMGLM